MQNTPDLETIMQRLSQLKDEHADLDHALLFLTKNQAADQLRVQRLKKRKLAMKDEIAYLENLLIPDLDA